MEYLFYFLACFIWVGGFIAFVAACVVLFVIIATKDDGDV